MAKFNLFRRLFTIQLICITVSILLVDVKGGLFKGLMETCVTVGRSLARVPSKMVDGGQYITQKVASTVSNSVGPSGSMKGIVDATGNAVSKVMGSTSRLLGKNVEPPKEVIFLYSHSLKQLGTSKKYQEMVRTVIGYALVNVVLHNDEMKEPDDSSLILENMPELESMLDELENAGASDDDIDDIISVLGRNGKQDLPVEIKSQVLSILKDTDGKFRSDGPMDELRWIADHPNGFYKMDDKERNDYKLKTLKKYNTCTIIHPPSFDNKNT